VAVNRKPQLLLNSLRRSGAIGPRISVTWRSPLEADGLREYRDGVALSKAGVVTSTLKRPLADFWPARGPVWDALGTTSDDRPVFVESKAHIPEAASRGTGASATSSRKLIERSLGDARRFYAPRATAVWSNLFYQYANRLAHQSYLRRLNAIPSVLVFVYFLNADEMLGPMSEQEWQGAIRLIHAVQGVPKDLRSHGVFDAFLDARLLQDAI
jgi:hypothetical protein